MADQQIAVANESDRIKAAQNKNEKIGHVVSTKMQKTIVVEVIRKVPHPLYKRIVTKKGKFYAHDEEESAKNGDVVRIVEHRPMSKLKRWILGEVIRRAVQVGVDPGAVDLQPVTATNVLKANSGGRGKKKK